MEILVLLKPQEVQECLEILEIGKAKSSRLSLIDP